MNSDGVFVKNPHSILAALKNRPEEVLEVVFPRELNDDVWKQIQALAARNRIKIQDKPKGAAKPSNKNSGNFLGRESSHGAFLQPLKGISVEEIFEGVSQETRGVWLALDSLQDPQNLGAIFRSASFFGVRGILLTTERSAPMSATVYDISAGGAESVPFAPVINLQRAFEKAKDAGLWILGTSEHAPQSLWQTKLDRPWLVVLGNEEKGLRRLTQESCDVLVGVPPLGDGVTSLNVSVATGVVLSHLCKPV